MVIRSMNMKYLESVEKKKMFLKFNIQEGAKNFLCFNVKNVKFKLMPKESANQRLCSCYAIFITYQLNIAYLIIVFTQTFPLNELLKFDSFVCQCTFFHIFFKLYLIARKRNDYFYMLFLYIQMINL